MKKRLLAALATGLLVVGMGGVAQALLLTPDSPNPPLVLTGDQTSESAIITYLESAAADAILNPDFESDLLYKDNVGGAEEGSFAPYYTTVFSNSETDPADAMITWYGGTATPMDPAYLLVKDGNQTPAWYLFNVTGWDGMETIYLDGFWPDKGAISNIAFFGPGGEHVPEPATMLLFGTGLAGLAGVARRRKKA